MNKNELEALIRTIPDFPKEGIQFKDITPIFQHQSAVDYCVEEIVKAYANVNIEAVAGIESRGFLLGTLVANKLQVPFVPIRKKGKLPYKTVQASYDLEYGSATIEMHEDAVLPGKNVLIHDDLLATGGTANAAAELIQQVGGKIAGFSFIIDLTFLNGKELLQTKSPELHSILEY